jgi:hypothetical protein
MNDFGGKEGRRMRASMKMMMWRAAQARIFSSLITSHLMGNNR